MAFQDYRCLQGQWQEGHSEAGSYVDLRAECDVLAVLSNCPQMHNPCNAYNLTPIRAIIWRPSQSGKP